MALLDHSWELKQTDRLDRFFLMPPGTTTEVQRQMESASVGKAPATNKEAWAPSPPCVLLTRHADPRQMQCILNLLFRAN